jgi:hypothetical protein
MNDSPAVILYDSDGNPVGVSEAGRLLVDTLMLSGKGAMNGYLENGGSKEMAIDSSAGPTVFEWTPGDDDILGAAMSFVMEDATIYFGDKFAGIAALTNGVLVTVKSEDVVYTMATLKRTREFFQLSMLGGFDVYAATPDCMRMCMSMTDFMFKKAGTYATDDYVRVAIHDDLDGLSHMSALFKGQKVA